MRMHVNSVRALTLLLTVVFVLSMPLPLAAEATSSAVVVQPATQDQDAESSTQATTDTPQVTFDGGLLRIHAQNSRLGDVLRAVEKALGAVIDAPGNVSEQVSIDVGPGTPLEILTSLLNGSSYDYYIVVGSELTSVSRIALTMRSAGQQTSTSSAATRRQAVEPQLDRQDKASLDAQRLQEIQRQQELQFEQQFGACIAQGCDRS